MAEAVVADSNGVVAEPVVQENGDSSVADQPAEAEIQQQEPEKHRGIYILRMPRPTFDDSAIKKLEVELSACFTKLKAMNGKAQTKRGEANELRKQLGVARSLRNGSSPEFDEKMTRLKQLREMRKAILDKVQGMKAGRSGLECRTEEELDEKVAEMEHSISHDGLNLNTEKQYVRQIAKLKSQRDKIREVQGQQENLAQMEAEAKKIKAVIDEVDSEVNILRGERDQAKDIIDDLQKKLQAVTVALGDYDAERQDIESTKRELQDQLKALREEIDSHMFEWRANRKLSLQLRDLVAEGKVDEATAIAEQQVESYLTKLLTDAAFRKEYTKLWSEQRRYLVSELLPESGAVEPKPAGAVAAKGAKGAAAKSAAPLVPQGAAKAQAIIAAALADADAAIAAKRLAEPQQPVQEEEPEAVEGEEAAEAAAPAEPAVRHVPGATDEMSAVKSHKAHKPAFDYAKAMSEMPEVPDYEYIMPPSAAKQDDGEKLSTAELKERVREEQRQKAQEAAERKKRRAEQLAKKAAAAAAKQKAVEQQAAAAAAAATAAASRAAALNAGEEVEASGTDGEGEVEQQLVQSKGPQARGNKHLPAKGKQHVATAKKPVIKKPAKVQKWHQQYATELAIGGVGLLMLILLLLFFTTK